MYNRIGDDFNDEYDEFDIDEYNRKLMLSQQMDSRRSSFSSQYMDYSPPRWEMGQFQPWSPEPIDEDDLERELNELDGNQSSNIKDGNDDLGFVITDDMDEEEIVNLTMQHIADEQILNLPEVPKNPVNVTPRDDGDEFDEIDDEEGSNLATPGGTTKGPVTKQLDDDYEDFYDEDEPGQRIPTPGGKTNNLEDDTFIIVGDDENDELEYEQEGVMKQIQQQNLDNDEDLAYALAMQEVGDGVDPIEAQRQALKQFELRKKQEEMRKQQKENKPPQRGFGFDDM